MVFFAPFPRSDTFSLESVLGGETARFISPSWYSWVKFDRKNWTSEAKSIGIARLEEKRQLNEVKIVAGHFEDNDLVGRCVSNHDHPANHPAIAFSRPRSIMFYNSAIETNGNCLFWIYGNPGESRNHVPHKLLAMEGSPRNRVLSGLCGQCQSESLAKLCKLWGFTGNIFQNMLHCETPQKIQRWRRWLGIRDPMARLHPSGARIPIQQVGIHHCSFSYLRFLLKIPNSSWWNHNFSQTKKGASFPGPLRIFGPWNSKHHFPAIWHWR